MIERRFYTGLEIRAQEGALPTIVCYPAVFNQVTTVG